VKFMKRFAAMALIGSLTGGGMMAEEPRVRARELGIEVGVLPPGPLNAITDVAGVRVGHATVIRGENIRTGVTAVLPHDGNLFREKVAGAVFVGNGFGKLMGSTQVQELGEIETPILLTSTLNVPRVADALIDYMLALPGNETITSVNPLIGETNDGRLNDIRARAVGRDEVMAAISGASSGAVVEGAVGAGTGTIAFGFKGGIGTSSRRLPESMGGYTVGVLVQSNYGGVLTIDGRPVGRELGRYYLREELEGARRSSETGAAESSPRRFGGGDSAASADGSIMIVIATDAPVDARNLERMGARAMMGLARTGAAGTNGSGDYAIAFSTARRILHGTSRPRLVSELPSDAMSPLFLAVIEATEEAVYNSLLMARTMSGNGITVEALPTGDL
jgi:D-aminopeptidase